MFVISFTNWETKQKTTFFLNTIKQSSADLSDSIASGQYCLSASEQWLKKSFIVFHCHILNFREEWKGTQCCDLNTWTPACSSVWKVVLLLGVGTLQEQWVTGNRPWSFTFCPNFRSILCLPTAEVMRSAGLVHIPATASVVMDCSPSNCESG